MSYLQRYGASGTGSGSIRAKNSQTNIHSYCALGPPGVIPEPGEADRADARPGRLCRQRRGHVFAMTLQCLQDADGQALGGCVISVDATESRRAQERMAVLGRAGSRFGSTLDAMHASQEPADLATS